MHRHIHYITPWRNNTRMPNKQTLAVPARLSSGRNLSPGLFIWPPCIISPCTTHYIQDTWTISLSHVDDQHQWTSYTFQCFKDFIITEVGTRVWILQSCNCLSYHIYLFTALLPDLNFHYSDLSVYLLSMTNITTDMEEENTHLLTLIKHILLFSKS